MDFKFMAIGTLIGIVVLFGVFALQQTTHVEESGKPLIVATFFPLQYVTERIVGDHASVESIVPANAEPHEYEPTPSDALKLAKAKTFVTLGLSFASMEKKLSESAPNAKIIVASDGVQTIETHEGGIRIIDPHVWINPQSMRAMAQHIKEELKAQDSENAEDYEKNWKKLDEEFATLDKEFSERLRSCKTRVILSNHAAFAYLAKEYDFTTISISGLEPEAEPTPSQFAALVDAARKYNVKYVLSEELVDPRVAERIASEIGGENLVLSPIEGAKKESDTYFSIQMENIAVLEKAMECT